jgi:hypothetical protein
MKSTLVYKVILTYFGQSIFLKLQMRFLTCFAGSKIKNEEACNVNDVITVLAWLSILTVH